MDRVNKYPKLDDDILDVQIINEVPINSDSEDQKENSNDYQNQKESSYKNYDEKEVQSKAIQQIVQDSFSDNREIEIIDIKTETNMFIFESQVYSVKSYNLSNQNNYEKVQRRYNDFDWLLNELKNNYPGIILPSLPQKTALAKINTQINLLESHHKDLIESRQVGLRFFLLKLLQHRDLRYAQCVISFLKESPNVSENSMNQFFYQTSFLFQNPKTQLPLQLASYLNQYQQFEITQSASFKSQNENNSNQGIWGKLVGGISGGISNTVSYYLGGVSSSDKERQRTPEDLEFENYQKFFSLQKDKLSEIVKCLSKIFAQKKIQANNMEQIAAIFQEMKNEQPIIAQIYNSSENSNYYQQNNIKDLVQQIEWPLKDHVKHLEMLLEILTFRKELITNVTQNTQALQTTDLQENLRTQTEKQIQQDRRKIHDFQTNFRYDYQYFSNNLNRDVKEILKNLIKFQGQHAEKMLSVWNDKPEKKN